MDARKVLTDREACEKAFDIEIDAQSVIEGVEFLTDAAIRSEDDFVKLPAWMAAAAVLVLNGVVTRPANSPRKTWRRKRADVRLRVRRRKPVDDPMILWVRHRFREIKSAAEANGQHISAYDARLQAAEEAKVKFKSPLSREQIADRSRRPARYAPSDIQPT